MSMPFCAGPRAAAVHIGADVLAHPRHARWARPLSCRDTAERLSRVCRAAGIGAQQTLLGADATTGRVRAAIAASAAATGPGGVLVVTFSGHSERPVPGEHGACMTRRCAMPRPPGSWLPRRPQRTSSSSPTPATPPSAPAVVSLTVHDPPPPPELSGGRAGFRGRGAFYWTFSLKRTITRFPGKRLPPDCIRISSRFPQVAGQRPSWRAVAFSCSVRTTISASPGIRK